jgi:hypothetical protein
MSTTVAVAEWITRLADDERQRDAVRVAERETAARKADAIRQSGRRLLDALRTAVTRDVEAFRDAFAGDRARAVAVDATMPDGAFVVRKPAPAAASLTVALNASAATLQCRYRFVLADGLPPREDRFDITFDGDGLDDAAAHMKHPGTGQGFATADALSEFLLVPVLTGRPR